MNETNNNLHSIRDIELLLPPPTPYWEAWWLILAITLGLSLLVWFIFYHRRQPRQRNLRRLHRLQQQLRLTEIGCHTGLFLLSDILRTSFQCTHVSARLSLPPQLQAYQPRWQSFTQRLDKLRYTGESLEIGKLTTVVDEAAFWIRLWPQ